MTNYHSDQASVYVLKRKNNRYMIPVLIIIGVLVIVMPIYGTTLRYQVSISIRLVCDYLGSIFQTIGSMMLLLALAKVLLSRKISLFWITSGIVLLYVGAFLMGGTVTIFGVTVYEPLTNPGYH